jgi:hypothetical protein
LAADYSEILLKGSIIPTKEDCDLDCSLTVLEARALEQLIMAEDLPPDEVRVLLQPLLEHLDWVLLPPFVQQRISH